MGNPPTPQGILQNIIFLFFFAKIRQVAKFAPSLGPVPLPPTPPEPQPLDPPPEPLYAPPPHRVSFKKNHFSSFFRNAKNRTQVVKFAPSLGPVPLPPTPTGTEALGPPPEPQPRAPTPATKALSLPPCPPGQLRWVPPTGHPSKNIIFLLFVRVRNVKNTTQVAKFAPSLAPVPLPPIPQSSWTPSPEPLYPPPPHRVSFKKNQFSSFCTH